MKYIYEEDYIEKKLANITRLIDDTCREPSQIDAKKIRASLDASQKLVNFLNNKELDIPLDKYNHFLRATLLLQDLLEIQKDMSNFAINKIDPTPSGIASQISNSLPSLTEKIGSDDANILLGVLKILSKPISYLMSIFESVSPDKWRVASNWERVKLVTGVTLTLVGVACVVAAIVVGAANPVGLTVMGGIGASLVVGSVALGLASVLCLGIGGVFLSQTGSTLSRKLEQKQYFKNMQNECDTYIKELDNKIKTQPVFKETSPEYELENRPNLTLSQEQRLTKTLENVQESVISIKAKLKPSSNN